MRDVFRILVGSVFIVAGIFFMIQGVRIYSEQVSQKDWLVTEATVTETRERVVSSGSRKHSSSRTVYDSVYEYEADGVRCEGERRGWAFYTRVGEKIEIKYNPNNPAENNYILAPDTAALGVNLAGGAVFVFMGLFAAGVLQKVIRYTSKKKAEIKE